MKTFKLILMATVSLTLSVWAENPEECGDRGIQVPASELLGTLRMASEGLYRDVSGLEVKHDGKGKLSIFFENGVPKLLKMTYTNGNGKTTVGVKSFEDLENNKPLTYENKDKPGSAIILERAHSFREGSKYNLVLKLRSSLNPEKFTSYPIEFDSDMSAPKLSANGMEFKTMVIHPGISWMSWDGTFKKVDFKN